MGIAAVLPLSEFRGLASVKQILKHWASKADAACKPRLAAVVAADTTALLVSERVVNAPPEVAAPLMAGLAVDLRACKTHREEADLRPYADVTHLLVCGKAYLDDGVQANESRGVPLSAAPSTSAAPGSSKVRRLGDERVLGVQIA